MYHCICIKELQQELLLLYQIETANSLTCDSQFSGKLVNDIGRNFGILLGRVIADEPYSVRSQRS